MARSRIVVRDLAKTFREGDRDVAAVAGVSFEVIDGEFVALVGPSGCGKSTILNMIGGLVDPSGGGIAIDAFPATLSGGMRQRVALMRTLVVDPGILLMDEPFGALDTHTKINLHAELLRLWEGRRQTVVFVTHDLSEAITLADRIVVMTRRPGRVKLIHHVKLPRPRDVIKLRATDEYAHEYSAIWNVLGEEFSSEMAP